MKLLKRILKIANRYLSHSKWRYLHRLIYKNNLANSIEKHQTRIEGVKHRANRWGIEQKYKITQVY